MTSNRLCAIAPAVLVGVGLFTSLIHSDVARAADARLALQAPVAQPKTSSSFKVILIGTGAGPNVDLQRYGPSTLVEAGGQRLLFDCGRGATIRMTQLGIPLNSVTRLFLTHLHSDHVIGIPDLFLTPWAASGRKSPFEVWGPDGTTSMMDYMQKSFEFDIRIRRDVDEKQSREGIRVLSHDVNEGVVLDENGVKVTAFLVDHGPVKPALGYRVDYQGRSVAISGDTKLSDNLIKFAQGVDVLVHSVIDAHLTRKALGGVGFTPQQIEAILDHHTSAEAAGEVFARVKPRLALYSHFAGVDLVAPARKAYAAALEVGEDLLTVDIGESIDVRRPAK